MKRNLFRNEKFRSWALLQFLRDEIAVGLNFRQYSQMTPDRYSNEFVKSLFNEMSKTYGVVNLLASFGFAHFWRRDCIKQIANKNHIQVIDLMAGMGENFSLILRTAPSVTRIQAIDFSSAMVEGMRRRIQHWPPQTIHILEEDVLHSSLASQSADAVYCSFGLKTLTTQQRQLLAKVVKDLLKPGGEFSFIEISVPKLLILRAVYLFYLRYLIPVVGYVCLGNPDNYRMLGFYTENFGDSRQFAIFLQEQGLEVNLTNHFFGCATGVRGRKSHS